MWGRGTTVLPPLSPYVAGAGWGTGHLAPIPSVDTEPGLAEDLDLGRETWKKVTFEGFSESKKVGRSVGPRFGVRGSRRAN